jgi:hypothetical protein
MDKIGEEETPGDKAFGRHQHGNSQENSGETAPVKDRNTTPQIHKNIEIKRGEQHNQMQKSVFH